MSQPREAVALPDGRIAVADEGNGRLVILDPAGHLLAIGRGIALQQPYAVAATPHGIVVLDSGRGSIDRFDNQGHFQQEISHDPALKDGHGMALGRDGRFYVANPRSNSLIILSAGGKIERRLSSPLGAGPGQFNQPSDVAVGPNGTLYVVDNQNDRIEALTPAGAFVRQWPAPSSLTIFSVHLLALGSERLLASDPSGALLVYPPGSGAPTREPLRVAGHSRSPIAPLGLSGLPAGRLLVTDVSGNRLLVVPVPT